MVTNGIQPHEMKSRIDIVFRTLTAMTEREEDRIERSYIVGYGNILLRIRHEDDLWSVDECITRTTLWLEKRYQAR